MNLYFDHNATTPLSNAVKKKMQDAMEYYANPSSHYLLNKIPQEILQNTHQECAKLLDTQSDRIVITSGGTESNNFALKSILSQYSESDLTSIHVISTSIEHPSILEVLYFFEKKGMQLTLVQPSKEGIISFIDIEKTIQPNTKLISMMAINNETGAIQDYEKVSHLAYEKGILFHVDAVQAVGKIKIPLSKLPGISTLSFSGHKFNGPKGIGGLFISKNLSLTPLLHGGGQEKGLRSGTENTIGLAGLGMAAKEAESQLDLRNEHYRKLRKALLEKLNLLSVQYVINGNNNLKSQAAWTLNISFDGIRAESLASRLSLLHGISLSLGSACSNNKKNHRSYVLSAMGLSNEQIDSAVRISFGHDTTLQEIDILANAIHIEVCYLLSLSGKNN
ncbi:cysteine desulfurase [Gilliamella sp. B2776]|uniref:cysteine desulfurase family protein n=1 Tax=unclassified Gilliamella TaxID=2685620 RepID=UPI00226AC8D8|nr:MULTISPECIES: cysteine desulfurase family protein [unclassified Gilliamella]MCX8648999.1 cysteine desulfurase [Gilliamella sp. B2779]MCX8653125.1 cysteine desulfurase [Gilliamella sp. B2737]MCX8655385.1 cysteine desulfurase [Gilliamella sp. B2894]MCX8664150.1 cysteine desulfurase [Gilliamella sp. B2887]MCX8690811.1 cysteine desulfurase [Gilliamella sp. B2776]